MALPRHIKENYKAYANNWPVLNFFNALVNDPQLAKDFEQADAAGQDEILIYFGLDPDEHLKLFTPPGSPRPLTEEEIRNILDVARREIVAKMPSNFW
jgi:hypothetical protein